MIIESEFSNTEPKEKSGRKVIYPFESSQKSKRVLLFWREHCHECSPPDCYNNCKNYLERSDGKCQLIENGISRISISGLLTDYGRDFKNKEFHFLNKHDIKSYKSFSA